MTSPSTPIQSPSDSSPNASKSGVDCRRGEQLDATGGVLERAEGELALDPAQHEPAGDASRRRRSRCPARGRGEPRAAAAAVARRPRTGTGWPIGHVWFFSKMRRRPWSVSHGSWCSMMLGERRDERGQPAGGDDRRRRRARSTHALADAVDLGGEAVDRARLDRLDRVLADHAAGLDELDPAQRRGPAEQGVEADLDAGHDGAAEVLALGRDGVERGGGAEVDDDRRARRRGRRRRRRWRCGRRRPPWGSRRGSACRSSRPGSTTRASKPK